MDRSIKMPDQSSNPPGAPAEFPEKDYLGQVSSIRWDDSEYLSMRVVMALCPECALNMSIPVTFTRDRCAYVVDLTLYTVESTAFGRQGPEVRILSLRPLDQSLTFAANLEIWFVGHFCGTQLLPMLIIWISLFDKSSDGESCIRITASFPRLS